MSKKIFRNTPFSKTVTNFKFAVVRRPEYSLLFVELSYEIYSNI
jgi:hypothetical protein